jgi:PIN domain nuclease of toxin-antitoxin system
MTYLVDTHIYLWMRIDPSRLSRRVTGLLLSGSTKILVSPVTPWELAIKAGSGKFDPAGLLFNFEKREKTNGLEIAEITIGQTIASGLLPLHHRDPFDRLLAAQSLDLSIPLISKDAIFDRYGVQRIWS